MKTISIKIIAFTALLSGTFLPSCSDKMLEEDLHSQVGRDNLEGVEGARLLTNGIYGYARFLSYYGGNNWMLGVEAATDEFFCNWGGIPETGWGGQQNFLNLDAGHAMVSLKWDEVYKIISQANEVIVRFGDETDPAILQYVAEARFWRALAYAKLYSVYGTVPLVTGTEDLSGGLARASEQELEGFIETELTDVEEILPSSYSTNEQGRPSRWAVKAFLARFYLNQKNWQMASDYAKDVIDNSGHSLMEDYQSIFSSDGNGEVILAINHVAQTGRGNYYVALTMDAAVSNAFGLLGVSGSNGYGMAVPFYQSFSPGDKRIAPYEPATNRGIAVAGVIYNQNGDPVYGTPANPGTVEANLNRVLAFKFPVQMNIPRGEDADADVPLLRLGETYLTYAEAQNELGHADMAATYVNIIRERAGLDGLPANLSTEAMREAILDERGWELYHEGYRLEDLLRHGKLLEKVNEKYQYYFNRPMPWAGDENRLLQPIPATALQLNPLMDQNPGY